MTDKGVEQKPSETALFAALRRAIAFDYTTSTSEETMIDYYGVKEFTQTMKEHLANEELVFSIVEGEIESFLEQRALKMFEHLGNEEIERTYLLGENGLLIGQITGHFRFVLASKNDIRMEDSRK